MGRLRRRGSPIIKHSSPAPSRAALDGSGNAKTYTDPPEGNAPLKRKTPLLWVPKNPVVDVHARLAQPKFVNTVPGWEERRLVVREYVPVLRRLGLALIIAKNIEAATGLLEAVLRLNDGPLKNPKFWSGVNVNDDPSGPNELNNREPAT